MKRTLNIAHAVRLALFALAYGLTGALMGGTLNRVMVADIGISIALVGFFFAVPMFVSPLRIWLGYRSDGFLLFGKRRESYIILGALVTAIGVLLTIVLATRTEPNSVLMMIGITVAFVIYGFGRNMAHNTYQALLADKFTGHQKARAITAYEVVTLLGMVMGSGGIGKALETYDANRVVAVALGTVIIAFVLTTIAVFRNEPQGDLEKAADKAREFSFKETFQQYALADRQVRIFFFVILFTFVGTLAQDVLLEPYGGLVLNMEVGETTRLTAFWGIGVIIAMLISGMFLVKRFGFTTVLRVGLLASMIAFAGVISIGFADKSELFRPLVFVMGLGTGIAGAGMLAGFMSFTTVARAGFLMGVWGMANVFGRALGSLVGGVIVDLVFNLTGSHLTAYGSVFALEVILLGVAFTLTLQVSPKESLAQQEDYSLELEAA
jgi:BCD family chlorophyll transporter-like MFS transporter